MNKTIEKLEKLRDKSSPTGIGYDDWNNLFKDIKEELQRLAAIDNAESSEALEDLKELHELAYGNEETSWKIDEIRMSSHIKQALLKLDFLEDAMDLPTNCFSTFENRNGNEVVVIRKELFKKYREQEKEKIEYKDFRRRTEVVKKALKKGIYARDPLDENKLNYIPTVALSNVGDEWYLSNHCDFCVNVRDYKELFWLKEDKSE